MLEQKTNHVSEMGKLIGKVILSNGCTENKESQLR